ncbi:MAG: DUF5652 family protein [bacterium]|nr:DUF5652 family protein [bacterium]
MIFLVPFLILLAGVAIVLSAILKGIALWRSAKRGEVKWFVALLVFNTVGILEALYLWVFSKRDVKE